MSPPHFQFSFQIPFNFTASPIPANPDPVLLSHNQHRPVHNSLIRDSITVERKMANQFSIIACSPTHYFRPTYFGPAADASSPSVPPQWNMFKFQCAHQTHTSSHNTHRPARARALIYIARAECVTDGRVRGALNFITRGRGGAALISSPIKQNESPTKGPR